MPCPAIASNRCGCSSDNCCSCAARTIASPSGCSLPRSALAASTSNCVRRVPGSADELSGAAGPLLVGMTSVTRGRPSVIVPVLSSTTVWIALARSRLSAFLMRMPCSAPVPVPTIMAVGVARPRAQGQAMTSTATAKIIAWVNPTPPIVTLRRG